MKETYAASDTDASGANDMEAMMQYFTTGKFVADTSRQAEVFGTPPEAADAVNRLLAQLGHLPR